MFFYLSKLSNFLFVCASVSLRFLAASRFEKWGGRREEGGRARTREIDGGPDRRWTMQLRQLNLVLCGATFVRSFSRFFVSSQTLKISCPSWIHSCDFRKIILRRRKKCEANHEFWFQKKSLKRERKVAQSWRNSTKRWKWKSKIELFCIVMKSPGEQKSISVLLNET
jgi:hypothetical protein